MQDDFPVDPSVEFRHRARIGGNHGYYIDGDRASLNADLWLAPDDATSTEWALQLWASDDPYRGGDLRGFKVAEVPVSLPPPVEGRAVRLEAETFAKLPCAHRDFSMILVLASSERGNSEKVRDYANYPNRERFFVPYLSGTIGYAIRGDVVHLSVDGVHNPRAAGGLSGSLALELWGLAGPLSNGVPDGVVLARAEIGQISGQGALGPLQLAVPWSSPPPGQWQVALLLREWTAAGFVTRDVCHFPVPFDSPCDAAGPPSHDEIALAAYLRYLARGRTPGFHTQDWLEAERELACARNTSARAGQGSWLGDRSRMANGVV